MLEEEEEPDSVYEALERKRQREIEVCMWNLPSLNVSVFQIFVSQFPLILGVACQANCKWRGQR